MVPTPNKLSQFWQELKRRKVIKAIAMYAGGAYVLIELANNVVVPLNLPGWTPRLVIILALIGFPVMVILSWIFDITPEGIGKTGSIEEVSERQQTRSTGKRRLRASDVIIAVLIVIVGILAYPRIFGSGSLNAMTLPVTVLNESGERETRRVFKEDYLTRLALFPFNKSSKDSLTDWLGWGIMEAVMEDQRQFSNMLIAWDDATLMNEQITYAREGNYPYFLTGDFLMDGPVIEITTRLYQTSNGAVRSTRDYRGVDFFELVDSICVHLRTDLGVSDIILKATPDLSISDLMTDNLDAYANYIRGRYFWQFGYNQYSFLNKAIETDSTFAKACFWLAYWCFNYQASHESAVRTISKAIRHRNRLCEFSDIETRMLYHMIMGNIESVIELSDIQYKLRPLDFNLLLNLHIIYNKLGLSDRAENIAIRMNELVPGHPPFQLLLADSYLCSGQPGKSMAELKTLLAENPEHVEAWLKMGEACLHSNELESAEQAFRQAILLMPEQENHWAMLLDHIAFVRNQNDIGELLNSFALTFRLDGSEFVGEGFVRQDQLFYKNKNQGGLYVYPVSDSILVTAFKNGVTFDFVKWTWIFQPGGKAIRVKSEQWSDSDYGSVLLWIEDSLILKAKDLLDEDRTDEALAAFREAYEQNPEHYYLGHFIQHLEFVTGPEYQSSASDLDSYTGHFGDLRIHLEDDRIYYTDRQGLIFELLPLSEDTYMLPSNYGLVIQLMKENGTVCGLKCLYRDGRERYFPKSGEFNLTTG